MLTGHGSGFVVQPLIRRPLSPSFLGRCFSRKAQPLQKRDGFSPEFPFLRAYFMIFMIFRSSSLKMRVYFIISFILRGGSRGRVQGVRTHPPPWDYLRFSNTTGIAKKNYVVYWCWSRARDECTPLKNPGSTPDPWALSNFGLDFRLEYLSATIDRSPVVLGSANLSLNFIRVSFPLFQKHSPNSFSILLWSSNHRVVDNKN